MSTFNDVSWCTTLNDRLAATAFRAADRGHVESGVLERREQRLDRRRPDGGDDIQIVRRARLAEQRAGDRAADSIGDPQSVENRREELSDGERVDGHSSKCYGPSGSHP